MTDQELDRALASALDVEHGSDFQARVRMRVAAEPAAFTALAVADGGGSGRRGDRWP